MAMYEGNWKCSRCGGAITQLPFEPRSESGLTCRVCYAKGKDAEKTAQPIPEMETATEAPDAPDYSEESITSEPMSADDAFAGLEGIAPVSVEKKTNTGNWTCSGCGGAITSLPFEPRNTENLKCIDCFKKSKG